MLMLAQIPSRIPAQNFEDHYMEKALELNKNTKPKSVTFRAYVVCRVYVEIFTSGY
ncbi:hypothetical protein HYPBUDRAFT_152634 [Hyphopichia burtonii NRRL Y-1933]|uniref:Uncharacterized protein n=1 Tax=Hyphopichia burtonii NRRL Y-1933 TaxID=984485 RepID=A0A1E4RKZ3_9ASCO|nr:hypothetical protein HYPBUDRAFT_152634 [Hyphopichia burtonii NRRL Y-1933]ODV67900.1 hypothetical protein HYPBUDRAFT_152634 [Hyphopichia burtonii NRRL Y-1933]